MASSPPAVALKAEVTAFRVCPTRFASVQVTEISFVVYELEHPGVISVPSVS
jgi:hypothetical protein